MTHASVFSGIGGPEVAADMLGWTNLFHCEINDFGRKVLEYHYPNAKSYGDITKTDFSEWRGKVDVLTGGFPCQPFSTAGKRRGAEDDRFLWPYMLRVIEQIRPTWFVAENVGGIRTSTLPGTRITMETGADIFGEENIRTECLHERFIFSEIINQIESAGYSVQPILIPACGVGAPHRRDRIFFVAHVIADTDSCNDREGSGADGTTEEKERIQKRNEVFESCKSDKVRSESNGVIANSDCCGSGTQKQSGCTFGDGSKGYEQQSKWRQQTERTNGLSEISWNAADTNNEQCSGVLRTTGEQRTIREERENRQDVSCEGYRMDLHSHAERIGEYGSSADTDNERVQRFECIGGVFGELREERTPNKTCTPCCDGLLCGEEKNVSDTQCIRRNERANEIGEPTKETKEECRQVEFSGADGAYLKERWRNFPTVSPVYRGNDGIPFPLDELTISPSKWATESLKAYGNAIVPQVMYEIFSAIEQVEISEHDTL